MNRALVFVGVKQRMKSFCAVRLRIPRGARVICVSVILFLSSVAVPQTKTAPPQSRPAPHIAGRLIGTDGVRKLILEYKTDSGRGTFVGNIHSTCMLPPKSNSSETIALELSTIPKGSEMTLFYVRHETRGVGTYRRENVVLAIRFDRLNGDSIPKGVMISCFKAAQPPSSK
jgi:hypothetical protein